jgi:hypothetical protein
LGRFSENGHMTTQDQKLKRKAEIEALAKRVEEGVSQKGLLSEMELSTEEAKQALGQRLMDEKLKALPPESGAALPCPRCGREAKVRAKNVPRTFRSLSGEHTYQRNYHYCEWCEEGFFPRDDELGLEKDSEVSNELAKRMTDFFLNDPFETCEERWCVHYPFVRASANQFRQVSKRLGAKLEQSQEGVLESALKAPSAVAAEVLYVQNDGAMISMQTGEWREVKSAVLFRSDQHLKGSSKKRGEILEARYVSVLGGQEEFKQALKSSLRIANAMPANDVVWLADGAKGNWNVASLLCPKAAQVLDWYHAIEHGGDCAKLLFGEEDACVELFARRIGDLLRAGEVKRCIRELLDCIELTAGSAQIKAITDLVSYYRSNQKRMRYDEYIAKGWLIGSGSIESAHRHVIQARMKRAGQHWSERGGRRMARMRAAYKTAGPARFFDAIHWASRNSMRKQESRKPVRFRASNR